MALYSNCGQQGRNPLQSGHECLSRETHVAEIAPAAGCWHELADRVLQGHQLTSEEGLSILRSPDEQLLDLLAATYRVRRQWWGNQVRLNFLINAKSGACAEDCGYCSQSRVSKAEISRYALLPPEQILDGARAAFQRKAKTYCIVTSGRGPGKRELDLVAELVPKIKQAVQPRDLRLGGPPGAGAGPAVEAVRRRPGEP